MADEVRDEPVGRGGEALENLPSGTLSFLYTDIEGSTRLWQRCPDQMPSVLSRHDQILAEAVRGAGGVVFRRVGDGVCAVFRTAPRALQAALQAQRTLLAENWPDGCAVRVRMAVHTGAAEIRDGDYVGHTLNRVARLLSAAQGGQILCSGSTYELVRGEQSGDVTYRDLGQYRLRDLDAPERIYVLAAPGLLDVQSPLAVQREGVAHLPSETTPFIGRGKERRAIRDLLLRSDVRLLTLTGPGGTGKTRLSLKVGADLADEFPDGVYFVPLDPVGSAALFMSAVANALDVQEIAGQSLIQTVQDRLRGKRLLLILDNFEHMVDAAPAVAQLLAVGPPLKMLVTSRTVLHLAGERDWAVPTLAVPGADGWDDTSDPLSSDAVALFVDRAQAARADFSLEADDVDAVVQICRRLDGLPLAIELAAARVRLFPPQVLLSRLDDRLQVLKGGARDLPPRQQTLRGAIDWSYSLLRDDDRELFERLSVFAGGWTLEAAEVVCGDDPPDADVLEATESLIDHSLIRSVPGDTNAARFAMLGVIRDYAFERLVAGGQADTVRDRHAAFYLDLAEDAKHKILGPEQGRWLATLAGEHDNVRAALAWLCHRDPADFQRLVSAMFWFWYAAGHWSEGLQWASDALAATPSSDRSAGRAGALSTAGVFHWMLGRHQEASVLLRESVDVWSDLDDPESLVHAILFLSTCLSQMGSDEVPPLQERLLSVARQHSYQWGIAAAKHGMGTRALMSGDYRTAQEQLEESVSVWRAVGDPWSLFHPLNTLGDLARIQGDYAAADRYYQESLGLLDQVGVKADRSSVLHNLGLVALGQGDPSRARHLFAEALTLFDELGDLRGMVESLTGFAGALADTRPDDAARVIAAGTRALQEAGQQITPWNRVDYDRIVAGVRGRLTEERWSEVWQSGQAMDIPEAMRLALAEASGC